MKFHCFQRITWVCVGVILLVSCRRYNGPDLEGMGILMTGEKEFPVLVNDRDGTHLTLVSDTLNGSVKGVILSRQNAPDVLLMLDEQGFPTQVLWGDSLMLVIPDQQGNVRVAMLRPGVDTLYLRSHAMDPAVWQFYKDQSGGLKSAAFWDPDLQIPGNMARIMQVTGMSLSVVGCLVATLNPAGLIALAATCGSALVDILMTFDQVGNTDLIDPDLEEAWFATATTAGIHECVKGTLTTNKTALISCIGIMVSTWQRAMESWATVSHRELGWTTDSRLALLGEPAELKVVSGDNQRGLIGTILKQAVWVQVVDAFGTGIAGVDVTFTGSSSTLTVKTNQKGLASVLWKLPVSPGISKMTVTARSHGAIIKGSPLTLTATAVEEESFYPSVWKMYSDDGYSGTLTFVDDEVVTWNVMDQLLTSGTYSLLSTAISFTIHTKQAGSGYDFSYYFTGQVQDSTMQGNLKLLIDKHNGKIEAVYDTWRAIKTASPVW